MSEQRRYLIAVAAAVGAALCMVALAVATNQALFAEFAIAGALAAALAVQLATRPR